MPELLAFTRKHKGFLLFCALLGAKVANKSVVGSAVRAKVAHVKAGCRMAYF